MKKLSDLSDEELYALAWIWYYYRPLVFKIVDILKSSKVGVALLDNGDTFESNGSI